MDMYFYLISIGSMLVGTATHVIKKVIELRKTDNKFHLKTYITQYPYKTTLTVLAGVAGYVGLLSAGELTYISAFMTGYMANSLGGAAE